MSLPTRAQDEPPGEDLYQVLLDGAPDAVVVVDGAGIITFVNQQTQRLFGYRREELLGGSLEVLGPARCRPQYPGLICDGAAGAAPTCPRLSVELVGRHKDGREFPLEVALSRAEVGGGLVMLA